jgi:hypothetical protein
MTQYVSVAYKLTPVRLKIGPTKLRIVTLTCGDSDYPSGGYSVTPAMCGFGHTVTLFPGPGINGIMWAWDATNEKLKAYTQTTGSAIVFAEATAAQVSDSVVYCLAVGH